MRVIAIIQARMGSTRLPGKVMQEVLGKPLLEYQLERVRRSSLIHDIVIATTLNDADQPIVDFCNQHGVIVYRGSENDVLSRYYGAAVQHHADVIVRITSDCPLIDPIIIDIVIEFYLLHQNLDYVSNTLIRTYPRGMDTEIFTFDALLKAHKYATEQFQREHVTPYIYQHPELFSIGHVQHEEDLSIHRWTVDTPEDFLLIRLILEKIYTKNVFFTMQDVLQLLDENPTWCQINAHIEQKKIV